MSEKNDPNIVHIGLKLADGSFYPIFEENFKGSKRLVLTTVRDNQESVQIDLYKGIEKEVFEDAYIGSLIIENLSPISKGAAEIELVIGINADGNLNASAKDLTSGERQALEVSLESLVDRSEYEMPDFELESAPPAPAETQESEETIVGESYPVGAEDRRRTYIQKKKGGPGRLVVILLIIFVLLCGIALGVYLLYPWLQTQFPDIFASGTTVVTTTEPSPSPSADKLKEETPPPKPETKEAETKKTDETADQTGTWYIVVKGDTLWDISRQFYREPLLYMKIANAKENHIPNPDLIFEKQKIFIPNK